MKSILILGGAIIVGAPIATTLALPAPIPNPAPLPAPPNIPSYFTASNQLELLVVAPQGPQTGYSRDLFPHWSSQTGSCNTREVVLKRDGINVVQDSRCAAVSGSWFSPFDGETWYDASDVDIDHLVPLSNAWKSGAASWSGGEREAFANDLTRPQLIAVTDDVNQEKSDSGPEEWRPPQTSYHCTYARMWIAVKSSWDLTITAAEKSALEEMLNTC
jgi:hypothetical protein